MAKAPQLPEPGALRLITAALEDRKAEPSSTNVCAKPPGNKGQVRRTGFFGATTGWRIAS